MRRDLNNNGMQGLGKSQNYRREPPADSAEGESGKRVAGFRQTLYELQTPQFIP
jgi:hypothetical protein